jgi:hypothetical protein
MESVEQWQQCDYYYNAETYTNKTYDKIQRIRYVRGNFQKYCVFHLRMASECRNMQRQTVSTNKHLEQLLRWTVLPIA